jgi:hypothetical protein
MGACIEEIYHIFHLYGPWSYPKLDDAPVFLTWYQSMDYHKSTSLVGLN